MEPQTPAPATGIDRAVDVEEFNFYVNNYGRGRTSKLTYRNERDESNQIATRLFVDDIDGRVMARLNFSKIKEDDHQYFLVRYYE